MNLDDDYDSISESSDGPRSHKYDQKDKEEIINKYPVVDELDWIEFDLPSDDDWTAI